MVRRTYRYQKPQFNQICINPYPAIELGFLWGQKMPLPNILEFAGTNITQRNFQIAQAKLLNFVGELDARQAATSGGYFKSYTDLVAANNDISNIPLGVTVRVNSLANGGDYYKSTENATTLTKSPYDPVGLANNYTDSKLSESVYTPGFKTVEGIITVNDYIIDSNINNAVLKPYTGGQYIKIPVKAGDQVKIEGSRNESTWRLNYINASGNRISVSENYGDGLYIVPAGAVFALKTVKSTISENIATTYLVYDALGNNRIDLLNESLGEVAEKVEDLKGGDPYIELVLEPIVGAAVATNSDNPNLLAPGVDRSYLQLDVSEFERIEIRNARTDIPQWVWVFADSQLNRLTISTKYGNGSLTIPSGAKYALRTFKAVGNIENSNLEITGFKSVLSVQAVYQELKTDIETLKNSPSLGGGSSSFGAMADMMSEMFKNGNVLKISEFSAPTQHEQIDTAIRFIKKRGWGILDMESGVWLRNSAVLLPDNCWIYLNEATVKLADGVFDNVFRNEGIVPNPDPFEYALELNENRNIRIFGKNKSVSLLSGPDVPYTAPHPTKGGDPIPWVGDFYGWRTLPVLFANVKDYKLHDFGMVKTTCWAISQEHGCENFEVYNIGFHTTVKNGDGVDVRQGCKKGKIYNITGFTGDDMVALSAIQNFIVQHPSGNYIYPMQVGGYGDRGFGGNIEDIQINSISGRGLHNGVRLLASGGSKLKKISVDNISDKDGTFNGAIVLVSSGYGAAAQMGDMTNITVNGIESNFSQTPLNVSGPIKDSSFNKIRQKKSTGVLYTNTATFDNTEITNASYV